MHMRTHSSTRGQPSPLLRRLSSALPDLPPLLPTSFGGSGRPPRGRRIQWLGLLLVPALFMLVGISYLQTHSHTAQMLLERQLASRHQGEPQWDHHAGVVRRASLLSLALSPDPRKLWDPAAVGRFTIGRQSQFCAAVAPPETNCIAVVGNGPISEEQRAEIRACDRVVRFNALNNWLPDDPMHLWVVRHNYRFPFYYWGFTQLKEQSMDVVEGGAAVLFMGGSVQLVDELLEWFPSLRKNPLFQLDIRRYQDMYAGLFGDMLRQTDARNPPDPSTGILGLLAVLNCLQRPVEVHLYGFNWSGAAYHTHMMGAEEVMVQQLRRSFPLQLHATACAGYRACTPGCDGEMYRRMVDGGPEECPERVAARKAESERLKAEAAAAAAGSGAAVLALEDYMDWQDEGVDFVDGRKDTVESTREVGVEVVQPYGDEDEGLRRDQQRTAFDDIRDDAVVDEHGQALDMKDVHKNAESVLADMMDARATGDAAALDVQREDALDALRDYFEEREADAELAAQDEAEAQAQAQYQTEAEGEGQGGAEGEAGGATAGGDAVGDAEADGLAEEELGPDLEAGQQTSDGVEGAAEATQALLNGVVQAGATAAEVLTKANKADAQLLSGELDDDFFEYGKMDLAEAMEVLQDESWPEDQIQPDDQEEQQQQQEGAEMEDERAGRAAAGGAQTVGEDEDGKQAATQVVPQQKPGQVGDASLLARAAMGQLSQNQSDTKVGAAEGSERLGMAVEPGGAAQGQAEGQGKNTTAGGSAKQGAAAEAYVVQDWDEGPAAVLEQLPNGDARLGRLQLSVNDVHWIQHHVFYEKE